MPIFCSQAKNTNEDNMLTANSINLGSPDNVDLFYVVGTGINSIEWTGFGDSENNNRNNIKTAGLVTGVDDKRYALYTFKSKTSGTKTLTFTGTDTTIEKLYLMETLFDFPDDDTFIELEMPTIERGAIVHESLYHDYSKVKGAFKEQAQYTAERQTLEKYRQFKLFVKQNTDFIFVENFSEFPENVYDAIMSRQVDARYAGTWKGLGINIRFTVTEK